MPHFGLIVYNFCLIQPGVIVESRLQQESQVASS